MVAIGVLALLIGCSHEDTANPPGSRGIAVPEGATIAIRDSMLSDSQDTAVRELLGGLSPGRGSPVTKPDVVFIAESADNSTAIYSVWISERFVYDGDHLDAWHERMARDTAEGYRLTKSEAKQIRAIAAELEGT